MEYFDKGVNPMNAVRATRAIDALLRFAIQKRLISSEDKLYAQNLLLDIMKMDACLLYTSRCV